MGSGGTGSAGRSHGRGLPRNKIQGNRINSFVTRFCSNTCSRGGYYGGGKLIVRNGMVSYEIFQEEQDDFPRCTKERGVI